MVTRRGRSGVAYQNALMTPSILGIGFSYLVCPLLARGSSQPGQPIQAIRSLRLPVPAESPPGARMPSRTVEAFSQPPPAPSAHHQETPTSHKPL